MEMQTEVTEKWELNIKKSIIHLSRNIIQITYTTFIFLKVF